MTMNDHQSAIALFISQTGALRIAALLDNSSIHAVYKRNSLRGYNVISNNTYVLESEL